MWSVVRYDSAVKCWVDLHGHVHSGHEIIPLPGTKLQIVITPKRHKISGIVDTGGMTLSQ